MMKGSQTLGSPTNAKLINLDQQRKTSEDVTASFAMGTQNFSTMAATNTIVEEPETPPKRTKKNRVKPGTKPM